MLMYFIYKAKNTKIDNMTTHIFNSEQYLNTGNHPAHGGRNKYS